MAIRHAVTEASVAGFRLGVASSAGIVLLAGPLGAGPRNPRRAASSMKARRALVQRLSLRA
jgi:type II secretory pathway predicted ATPase ExeA